MLLRKIICSYPSKILIFKIRSTSNIKDVFSVFSVSFCSKSRNSFFARFPIFLIFSILNIESSAMEENQSLLFESFFNSISLPKLTYHWHVLLLSTLTCNVTVVISRLISSYLFPKTYNNLQGLKKLNWDIHFVSMVHCLLVVLLSIPIFWDEELIKDKVFGYDNYAGNVYSIACGYVRDVKFHEEYLV